jgi:hypothetical protein
MLSRSEIGSRYCGRDAGAARPFAQVPGEPNRGINPRGRSFDVVSARPASTRAELASVRRGATSLDDRASRSSRLQALIRVAMKSAKNRLEKSLFPLMSDHPIYILSRIGGRIVEMDPGRSDGVYRGPRGASTAIIREAPVCELYDAVDPCARVDCRSRPESQPATTFSGESTRGSLDGEGAVPRMEDREVGKVIGRIGRPPLWRHGRNAPEVARGGHDRGGNLRHALPSRTGESDARRTAARHRRMRIRRLHDRVTE